MAFGCASPPAGPELPSDPGRAARNQLAQTDCRRDTFPSFYIDPPPDWDGPVFELSQSYPDQVPEIENYPWLAIPVDQDGPADPEACLMALKEYVFEGNTSTDP